MFEMLNIEIFFAVSQNLSNFENRKFNVNIKSVGKSNKKLSKLCKDYTNILCIFTQFNFVRFANTLY